VGEIRAHLLVCDVGQAAASLAAVDALARCALAARRVGCRLEVRGASAELVELIELAGLAETLGLEPRREPEEREERLGVEEEADAADPVA
jgi:hypothetical protein